MDDHGSGVVGKWAITISSFLMVSPWLELALKEEPWQFFLTGACWALAATLFVFAREITTVPERPRLGFRPLVAFLAVATFAALGSYLFDLAARKMAFDDEQKARWDVVFAVLGTFFTVWICWKLARRAK